MHRRQRGIDVFGGAVHPPLGTAAAVHKLAEVAAASSPLGAYWAWADSHPTANGALDMARPITLFTGQWADLPFTEVCRLASEWGYDGLEIACWGDHFQVDKALAHDSYVQERKDILVDHGLQVWAISNHLVGQAVCDDPIDARHRGIVPPRIWGDGDPEGVRRRAAGSASRMLAKAPSAAPAAGVPSTEPAT